MEDRKQAVQLLIDCPCIKHLHGHQLPNQQHKQILQEHVTGPGHGTLRTMCLVHTGSLCSNDKDLARDRGPCCYNDKNLVRDQVVVLP